MCLGFYITCVFWFFITCVFWVLHHLCVSGFISLVCSEFYITCVFWILNHLCVLWLISLVCFGFCITCSFWVLQHLCVRVLYHMCVLSSTSLACFGFYITCVFPVHLKRPWPLSTPPPLKRFRWAPLSSFRGHLKSFGCSFNAEAGINWSSFVASKAINWSSFETTCFRDGIDIDSTNDLHRCCAYVCPQSKFTMAYWLWAPHASDAVEVVSHFVLIHRHISVRSLGNVDLEVQQPSLAITSATNVP